MENQHPFEIAEAELINAGGVLVVAHGEFDKVYDIGSVRYLVSHWIKDEACSTPVGRVGDHLMTVLNSGEDLGILKEMQRKLHHGFEKKIEASMVRLWGADCNGSYLIWNCRP